MTINIENFDVFCMAVEVFPETVTIFDARRRSSRRDPSRFVIQSTGSVKSPMEFTQFKDVQ